jgi:hypothetical protein
MVRRQQAADRAVRPKLRSPGHPKYQRHVEVAFWDEIAKGLLAEEAAGLSAWRRRWPRAGSASVAACDRSIRSRIRAGICRFVSGRRSRS